MNVCKVCSHRQKILGKALLKAELFYHVVKPKRRHSFAVTLTFMPCGDCKTDIYYNP